ncbi:MAG: sugar phosphate isomerase/epimerase [Clostridia bacterium]|nr:sugar phosphate isomerase/epimerase [Clostridia bacterium]
MKVGVQMYTVRDYCKDLDGFADTLARLADMGFSTVQVSGTCAYEADWLAEQLKKNGLTCNLTHYNYDRIINETEKVIEEHKTFGCKYIGVGSLPGIFSKEQDKIPEFCETFVNKALPAAKQIADAGLLFMYHNHSQEYTNKIDGKTCMEYLSDKFAPNEMGFTLDTYWVKFGGYDPVDEVKRLNGRLPCVHFKDMAVEADGERHFTWCGNGIIDFSSIGQALKDAGTEYIFIEQDKTFDCEPDPFKCLANSKRYLESIGFEF